MRRKILPTVAAALALGVAGASTANAGTSSTDSDPVNDCAARNSRGRHLHVVGLVADGTLVCFRDDRPGRAVTIGEVSGLVQDISIVGIDYRPAKSLLYGLGNAGGVDTIDANTAEAQLTSRLDKALDGTSFGVDFNPTVDRLRIVSDTGQNLRTNVDDGTTTADSNLNIPGPTPGRSTRPASSASTPRPARSVSTSTANSTTAPQWACSHWRRSPLLTGRPVCTRSIYWPVGPPR